MPGRPKRDLAEPPRQRAEGFAFGRKNRLLHKLNFILFLAAPLAFAALIGVNARSAELEGALQYPPLSIGKDAQPPPPARMVPPLVSPLRIELDGSGPSMPPNAERLFMLSPIRFEHSGYSLPTESQRQAPFRGVAEGCNRLDRGGPRLL